jgi:dienelactone hydrolase
VRIPCRGPWACALVLTTAALAQTAPPVARKALDLLLAEKYPDFIVLLSPLAKEKLTLEFLNRQVGVELRDFGKPRGVGNPVAAKDGTNTLVSFPVQFPETTVNVQFTLNAAGQVAGLYFRPAGAPLPALWKRPSYSNPALFRERDVTVGADPWKLGATLTVPAGKGRFPAVVLVHGPGPLDRDESIYSNHIFRDIAEGLATRGIGVLRYDKRTRIYGEKMSDMDFTIQDETVDDALKAVALARQQPDIDPNRVFVLGHSLGGYISPRIAARDGKLAGLIFLAANARPIEDVALEQNEYMVGKNPPPEVLKRLDDLRAEVSKVKQLQAGKSNPMVVMGLPSGYLLDLKGYDPASQAKRLTIPMLFLQGDRDFQVTTKDFTIWKNALAGRANAAFHDYPGLNHLFIAGEGKSSPAEYRNAGNVDAKAIQDIAAFILATKPMKH